MNRTAAAGTYDSGEHSNEFDKLKLLKGTDNIIAYFLASPQQSVRQPYLPIVL